MEVRQGPNWGCSAKEKKITESLVLCSFHEIQDLILHYVGFEVLTAVVMEIAIFWDLAQCSPNMNRCFGGMYHLHFQGRKSAEPMGTGEHPFLLPSGPYITVIPTDSSFCLAICSHWFLIRLIFDHEDGGDMFLRNVGSYTDYRTLFPRRR
jgi:hypothetical protein